MVVHLSSRLVVQASGRSLLIQRYCEERPLLVGNVGMGARLCTYYQKSAPGDQTGTLLRNGSNSLGSVLILDPADKSPFLGDIKAGCSQSCLETNLYSQSCLLGCTVSTN
ncbi:Transcription initiation factor TFIID subunit 1 [Sarracenia purpurea var. burkii]